jgi:hypothetical protein
MTKEITLVETRTFWVALLGLVAEIAKGLHLPGLLGFANDPHTVDLALNLITAAAFVGTMWTRKAATAKVVGLFSPKPDTLQAFPPVMICAFVVALAAASPAGCNDQAVKDALARIHADIKSAEQIAGEAAPQICADIAALEQTGEVVLGSGLVGGTDVSHARTVEAGIDALCANPTAQNAGAIAARGVAAYAQLAALFKKAAPK